MGIAAAHQTYTLLLPAPVAKGQFYLGQHSHWGTLRVPLCTRHEAVCAKSLVLTCCMACCIAESCKATGDITAPHSARLHLLSIPNRAADCRRSSTSLAWLLQASVSVIVFSMTHHRVALQGCMGITNCICSSHACCLDRVKTMNYFAKLLFGRVP